MKGDNLPAAAVSRPPCESPERRYFDVLKRISAYDSPEWIRRHAEKRYGLTYHEALEMAYDNIRNEAIWAVKAMSDQTPEPETWPCNDCGLPCLKGDELCGPCYEKERRSEESEAMHPEWRCPPRE